MKNFDIQRHQNVLQEVDAFELALPKEGRTTSICSVILESAMICKAKPYKVLVIADRRECKKVYKDKLLDLLNSNHLGCSELYWNFVQDGSDVGLHDSILLFNISNQSAIQINFGFLNETSSCVVPKFNSMGKYHNLFLDINTQQLGGVEDLRFIDFIIRRSELYLLESVFVSSSFIV